MPRKAKSKWTPGGRGRPPKSAKQGNPDLKPAAPVGRVEASISDAALPAGGPPASEASTGSIGAPAAPAPAELAPAPAEPPKSIPNPLRAAAPPAAPAPPGRPAWEDPAKVRMLIVPATIVSAHGLDFVCRKAGKQPLEPGQVLAARIPELLAQTVIAWFPDLDVDPRIMLTLTLAGAVLSVVQAQPDAPRPSSGPFDSAAAPPDSAPIAPSSPPPSSPPVLHLVRPPAPDPEHEVWLGGDDDDDDDEPTAGGLLEID